MPDILVLFWTSLVGSKLLSSYYLLALALILPPQLGTVPYKSVGLMAHTTW